MKLSTVPGLNVGNKQPLFQKSDDTGTSVQSILSIDELKPGMKFSLLITESNLLRIQGICKARGFTNPKELLRFMLEQEAQRLLSLQWEKGESDLNKKILNRIKELLDENSLRRILNEAGINDEVGIERAIQRLIEFKEALALLGLDTKDLH